MANRVRFAPPKTAQAIPVQSVKDGDWAFTYGYWWKVVDRRAGGFGIPVFDVESPRGIHYALYPHDLMRACRG